MSNENNNVNKDIANSLSEISGTINKGTNVLLDSANQINNWYAEQLNKISEGDIPESRLETNVDNTITEENIQGSQISSKIETKVEQYDELQTNNKNNLNIIKNTSKIKTQQTGEFNASENIANELNEMQTKKTSKIPKRISTAIKGTKLINNTANRFVKTGKSINTAINEGGLKSFENSSSRIMTKPVKKVANKITSKATNIIGKGTKKVVKKASGKIVQKTTNVLTKVMKLLVKLIANTMKLIISMLPQIAPILIIIVVIAAFCSFFGIGMSEDTKKNYEQYMITVQDEYDVQTVEYYNQGNVVEGAIEGKGFINWKAPLAIIQMLNGDLTFDSAEQELLNAFKNAGLYETVTEVTYTYEQQTVETDNNGNTTTKTETITATKKVVSNPSLDDYISWCSNNFNVINKYKKSKKISYDSNQTAFTDSEIEQIKLLYNSNTFFDLFSSTFQERYAYLSVSITDEQIQAIYNEFLANAGTRYLMDHSNLSYDTCMDYYDCSSWVIHCLAHCGIIEIPNTGASGIYNNYCVPISVDDRQAGDLIFLKDTYDTGNPGGISHVGIYMGTLTINGETAEWVIDTGSNPSGVRIRKYNNGWWNSEEYFYGFGRLK